MNASPPRGALVNLSLQENLLVTLYHTFPNYHYTCCSRAHGQPARPVVQPEVMTDGQVLGRKGGVMRSKRSRLFHRATS